MLKTIFAITIIGMASNADAAQLTIAEKLEDIRVSKEQIRQAIESQGVEVPVNVPLSQYEARIRQIAAIGGFIGSSVNFCSSIISSSTALSINSIFNSICSPLSATTKFPYANCGGYTPTSTGTGTYDWTATSCPLVSTTATIYGRARCSTQRDTAGHGFNSADHTANGACFRATNGASNNPGTGQHCWCQLCANSSRMSCGGWIYRYEYDAASTCASRCAHDCGNDIPIVSSYDQVVRVALCAAPAP